MTEQRKPACNVPTVTMIDVDELNTLRAENERLRTVIQFTCEALLSYKEHVGGLAPFWQDVYGRISAALEGDK